MIHEPILRLCLFTILSALIGTVAAEDAIYKWVTPDGVTHFSGTAPEASFASVEVIELEPLDTVITAPRDYRAMLEVAERIEAARLQRERLRFEKRSAARQRRAQDTRYPEDDTTTPHIWYSPYAFYPRVPGYYPPRLHGKPRPRPEPYHGRDYPPLKGRAPGQGRNSLAHIPPP